MGDSDNQLTTPWHQVGANRPTSPANNSQQQQSFIDVMRRTGAYPRFNSTLKARIVDIHHGLGGDEHELCTISQ